MQTSHKTLNENKGLYGFLVAVRLLVGILFIFSGLVKLNDPVGLSYKMQEFFEVWGLALLNDYTLFFSLAMNTFEIVAGVAVILGWRMKLFSWLLLLLIIFFTFLTGYAVFSGKIKTCGCFGDCIPLTAQQSFIKDLVLLVLIIIIFYKKEVIQPFFQSYINGMAVLVSVAFCVALQWYVLIHLPVVDCLPYKKGNNIAEKMQIPAGAIPDSFAINFRYKHKNEIVEFDMDHFPIDFNDSSYTFIERIQKLIRKGNALPPINDFALQTMQGNDTTLAILNQENVYVMVFLKDLTSARQGFEVNIAKVAKACQQQKVPLFVVTAVAERAAEMLSDIGNINYLQSDATVIKTAARDVPTYFVMKQGTIMGKFANIDYHDAITMLSAVAK